MRTGILSLLLVASSLVTQAWNARGHMIIAAIAYQELTKDQQQYVTQILINHPEYSRNWKPDYEQLEATVELGLYLFMRASIWADDIRATNYPDHQYDAPKWHYMNYELRFPYDGELVVSDDENVLLAININLEKFKSSTTSKEEKAIALCWLIHLIGDIHQPLHTVSLFSEQFPNGDRGGNGFWIKPKGAVKLHSYWDGLMGRSTDVRSISNEVSVIKSTYQKDQTATVLDPVTWSLESCKLAKEKVYLNGALKGSVDKQNALPIPENYGKESKKVGEQQVALSGYRLAKILGF